MQRELVSFSVNVNVSNEKKKKKELRFEIHHQHPGLLILWRKKETITGIPQKRTTTIRKINKQITFPSIQAAE